MRKPGSIRPTAIGQSLDRVLLVSLALLWAGGKDVLTRVFADVMSYRDLADDRRCSFLD